MVGNISKKRVDMEVANSIKEILAEAKKVAGNVNSAVEKYPYVGENGNWFVWDVKQMMFVDTNVSASGLKPEKGTDYWTDEDKAEIKSYVDEAILGGEW